VLFGWSVTRPPSGIGKRWSAKFTVGRQGTGNKGRNRPDPKVELLHSVGRDLRRIQIDTLRFQELYATSGSGQSKKRHVSLCHLVLSGGGADGS
jgi:hypothetical protein